MTASSGGTSYELIEGVSYDYTVTGTEWRGKNNTGIRLVKCDTDDPAISDSDALTHRYVTLFYGKTDSDETIEKIYEEFKQDRIEQEQNGRDSANTDGL